MKKLLAKHGCLPGQWPDHSWDLVNGTVHSVTFLVALLLLGTAYIIYGILTYDDRFPNEPPDDY